MSRLVIRRLGTGLAGRLSIVLHLQVQPARKGLGFGGLLASIRMGTGWDNKGRRWAMKSLMRACLILMLLPFPPVHTPHPPLSVVCRFVHLLNQSQQDFLAEAELLKLQEEVVRKIRSNQQLEQDLNLMDIKIGLLVKNRITLQVRGLPAHPLPQIQLLLKQCYWTFSGC